jgi:hypothetical protein
MSVERDAGRSARPGENRAGMTLVLRIEEPGASDVELEHQRLDLRRELLELDVQDVTAPVAGAAPPGTRAIELADVGALLIVLQQSTTLLQQVVGVVRRFLRDRAGQAASAKVVLPDGTQFEMSGMSADSAERVVDHFIKLTREG